MRNLFYKKKSEESKGVFTLRRRGLAEGIPFLVEVQTVMALASRISGCADAWSYQILNCPIGFLMMEDSTREGSEVGSWGFGLFDCIGR